MRNRLIIIGTWYNELWDIAIVKITNKIFNIYTGFFRHMIYTILVMCIWNEIIHCLPSTLSFKLNEHEPCAFFSINVWSPASDLWTLYISSEVMLKTVFVSKRGEPPCRPRLKVQVTSGCGLAMKGISRTAEESAWRVRWTLCLSVNDGATEMKQNIANWGKTFHWALTVQGGEMKIIWLVF